MIDLFFRCETRARWQALGVNRGILAPTTFAVMPGYSVDELGNYVITPAVFTGTPPVMTTPPVMDTWWTVNVRLTGAAADADVDTTYPGDTGTLANFNRSKIAAFVRAQGTLKTVLGMRAYEFGATPNRVQIFDGRDVVAPQRVWLGGMSY